MKKVFLLTLLLLSVLCPMAAQNNPYDIDDECYSYFQQAELLLGREGFEEVNARLLARALACGDDKAETIFYVERLKNLTHSYSGVTTTEEDDMLVLKEMETLKSIARSKGYIQYYYYAYDVVQNYFFNHDKFVRTMDLVQEMREYALRVGEEYGVWMGSRYLVNLYIVQNDYVSAKKYILEALKIFNESTDPTIRRQSASRLYCDLANTYPIGHDSVRINVQKALDVSKQHLDTLRYLYHMAKLDAFNMDIPSYEATRDACLADPALPQVSATAARMFSNIDNIVYGGSQEPEIRLEGMMTHLREVKYIANIAENYGFKDLAFRLEKDLVAYEEQQLSKANQTRLSELDARLGNDRLTVDLERKTQEALRSSRLVTILLTTILLAILSFVLIQLRMLRIHKNEDEALIADLKEANEKVRLADAAKTRFVQNMSHEVRTPLNAIVGFSQLLSLPDGSFPPEEKDEFSGHIINNTKMLTMLLDDILNVSAMDSGNYRISYEEGEMHFIARSAISSAEHRLQPGVQMFYVPESEEPFSFTTDPRRVQQILINLLTNSCKHTTAGEIRLSSSLTACPGYVTYAVTDTGPGVPADQAEKIFERFTKLNEFVQGTGLGLSICRDIAGRMGARVYLDTTYTEGGARFVFEVPVSPEEDGAAPGI